ncbi:MAG: WecB/TagA/CpsF family glycosyltransferase [Nitrospira sp.]|jgi:N-acetylglucosaminyldiphosphoundecaprenol N-acetyl-beta-D-mannosaminyltransferase|nr:WecB/TagA/CpsF family glycosyltransferase [Nitrospira sp.]
MAQRRTEIILDIPVDRISLETATEVSVNAISGIHPQIVFACANPHSLVVAQTDSEFKEALTQANLVVADGVGITLTAKMIGLSIGQRITGHDYFFSLLKSMQHRGQGRVFFFGSSQQVLALLARRFVAEFPELTLCGTYSPPFGSWSEEEDRRMTAVINEATPDVLWVGMTAPKQEKWVAANCGRLNARVIGSIGAVFDFYAGTYSRAPRWISKIGLEWAYRFILEPRRMWRRNFVSTPRFIWLVLKQHVLGLGR